MQRQLEPSRIRLDLDQAMSLVSQDRWVLGGIREGRLRVLADSAPERHRPLRRVRELSRLARRCLHDRRPLTVSAVTVQGEGLSGVPPPAGRRDGQSDWEVDWPALLYAPVGIPGRRPIGLLIAGCQGHYWYTEEEIDYVAGVAIGLTAAVLSLDGPLARLTPDERAAARLLAQGLSVAELARAVEVERPEALELVGGLLRKLSLRSPKEIAGRWPELVSLP